MQIPQVALAAICLLLGILPALAYGLIQRALAASPNGLALALGASAPFAQTWSGVALLGGRALYVPLVLAGVVALAFLLARLISRLGAAPRRAAVPWLCGYAREAECNRYVAHGFYTEISRYFRWLGKTPAPRPAKPADLKET
jgi:hypothetical protein